MKIRNILLALWILILTACGTGQNAAPRLNDTPYMETLANGAILTIPNNSFSVMQGESTSSSVTISNNNLNDTITLSYSLAPANGSTPVITTNPTPCVISGNGSCQIFFNAANAPVGTYLITPNVIITSPTLASPASLPPFPLIVKSNSSMSSHNFLPNTILGSISFSPESMAVVQGESTQVVVTLSNSQNINNLQVNFTVESASIESPIKCILSTENPTCSLPITSLKPGTTAINATANNYTINPLMVNVNKSTEFAYIVDIANGQIWQYQVSNSGQFTYISAVPKPGSLSAWTPVAIAVNGSYAYVVDLANDAIWQYAINSTTGQLSDNNEQSIPLPEQSSSTTWMPWSITFNGNYAYISAINNVWQYAVNSANGNLSNVNGGLISLPPGIAKWYVDSIVFNDNYAYIRDTHNKKIWLYFIEANGQLSNQGASLPIARSQIWGEASPVAFNNGNAYVIQSNDTTGEGNILKYSVDSSGNINSTDSSLAATTASLLRAISFNGNFAYIITQDASFKEPASNESCELIQYKVNSNGNLNLKGNITLPPQQDSQWCPFSMAFYSN